VVDISSFGLTYFENVRGEKDFLSMISSIQDYPLPSS
jgi:hypothetical protein